MRHQIGEREQASPEIHGYVLARAAGIEKIRWLVAGLCRKVGRAMRNAGTRVLDLQSSRGVWIDVGAHHGEMTLSHAQNNPALTVYAFEPNWDLARCLMGKLPNFIVLPMAVSDKDGVAEFFLNEDDLTSSLLPFNPQALEEWKSFEGLKLRSKKIVPTIRLDTFLESMAIDRIDFLKIDAQGADFSVIRSAGAYLERIQEVLLEVDIGKTHLYSGATGRDEVIGYMNERGFKLSKAETQSEGKEQNLTFIPNVNLKIANGSSANG